MSEPGTLCCRECGARLRVRKGRNAQARRTDLGVIRTKRCGECGADETTVELSLADLPKLVLRYLAIDTAN